MKRPWWLPLWLLANNLVPAVLVLAGRVSVGDVLTAYLIECGLLWCAWVVFGRPKTERWAFYLAAALCAGLLYVLGAGTIMPYAEFRTAGVPALVGLLLAVATSVGVTLWHNREHVGRNLAWSTTVLFIGMVFGGELADRFQYLYRDGWVPGGLNEGGLNGLGESIVLGLIDHGVDPYALPVLMLVAFRALNEIQVVVFKWWWDPRGESSGIFDDLWKSMTRPS